MGDFAEYGTTNPFSCLSLCPLDLKFTEGSQCYRVRRITAHTIPKEVNPSPCRGILIQRLWKMVTSPTLVPAAVCVAHRSTSPCTVPYLKSLPGSIFITHPAWMSNSISSYKQTTCLDRARSPFCLRVDWCVPDPPTAALFQMWKQTLAGWTLPFYLMFYLFLSPYVTSLSNPTLAIASRNHPSKQWGNNRSSRSLGRNDCRTFHYDWGMSDCFGDGKEVIGMNWL